MVEVDTVHQWNVELYKEIYSLPHAAWPPYTFSLQGAAWEGVMLLTELKNINLNLVFGMKGFSIFDFD